LGGGALWWLGGGNDPGLSFKEERGAAATAQEASLVGTKDTAAAAPTEASANHSTERSAVAEAAGSAAARPFPTDAEWIDVTVVHDEPQNERPAVDAEVGWYAENAGEELSERFGGWSTKLQLLFADAQKIAAMVGWQARTDGQGKVRVTLKDNTRIVAQKDGLYGELQLQKNTLAPRDGYKLRLAPDRTLRVQVLDAAGKPVAGIPVTLTLREGDGDFWGGIGWAPLATSEGPDGIATIRHLQRLGQDNLAAGETRPKDLVAIPCLYLPGIKIEGTKIDLDAPPADPVTLRLPTCGAIHVRATMQGKPATDFRQVWLSHNQQNEEHDYTVLSASLEGEPGEDGIARFAHVLLGQQWTLYTQSAGGMYREIAGPVAPGQIVEVELAVDTKAVILAGRLVDAAHQPMRNREFSFQGRGEDYWNSQEGKTDRDGHFSIAVGTLEEPTQVDHLTFDVVKKGERTRRGQLPARVLRPGVETVGDVVLGDGPLVVGGKIVRNGKPVPRDINLYVQQEVVTPDSPEPSWMYVEDQYHYVAEDGTFEVRGTSGTGRHQLYVAHGEILPMDPIEFRPGRADLEIVLGTSHALAASLLVEDGTHLEGLQFVLVPSDGKLAAGTPGGNGPPSLGGNENPLLRVPERSGKDRGDVRWAAVPPGTYALQARCWSREAPLLTIDNVVVPPPESGDPRLADIDLRGLIRTIEITLRDPDGEAMQHSWGSLLQASPGGGWLAQAVWGTPIHATLPRGPYDLMLGIDGWRPKYIRGDADKVEIRMEGWPRIPVTIADLPKLPEGARVYGRLEPTGTSPQPFKTSWGEGDLSQYTAPSENVDLMADGASMPIGDGPHRLNLYVYGRHNMATIEVASPQQVLPNDQRIMVRIATTEWERVLKAIGTPPQPDGQTGR
jgi:hypothetical protein